MAACVQLVEVVEEGIPQGVYVLQQTGQAVADCSGYVLISPAEHAWSELVQQAFASPTVESASAHFVGGFAGVLTFYVVARIFGAVIQMFDD